MTHDIFSHLANIIIYYTILTSNFHLENNSRIETWILFHGLLLSLWAGKCTSSTCESSIDFPGPMPARVAKRAMLQSGSVQAKCLGTKYYFRLWGKLSWRQIKTNTIALFVILSACFFDRIMINMPPIFISFKRKRNECIWN